MQSFRLNHNTISSAVYGRGTVVKKNIRIEKDMEKKQKEREDETKGKRREEKRRSYFSAVSARMSHPIRFSQYNRWP